MNATLIRYAITAVASALIVGGLSALMATSIMQSKVDDEIKARQAIELTFSQAQKATAENNAQALEQLVKQQQEQLKKNAKLSDHFYDELKKITVVAHRIEQQIPDAVAQDGSRYTGIGANGLQLYRAALGYSDATPDDIRVPNAPERTITAPTKAVAADVRGATGATQTRQGLRAMESGIRAKVDSPSNVGASTEGSKQ